MVYLDNAATTWPKPEEVYQAMDVFMRQVGANPGRSGHRLSIEAGRVIYDARESIAQLFHIEDPLRIVFTKNTTEALNIAILGLLRPGDHAITTSMEHNSVMRPLRALEARGVQLTVVECSSPGSLEPVQVEKAIKPNTRLIAMNHASNVIGVLLPVSEVGRIARACQVPLLVDAAQTAGCYPIEVEPMNIDLLAFSGHKGLYGPQGTGGLYIRKGIELKLKPLMHGGTGSRSESEEQPDFLPDKYESGTPNTVGIAGLGAGVRFVLSQGVAKLREKEQELTARLLAGLRSIPGISVYGDSDARRQVAVVSFNISGLFSSEVATRLEEEHQILCRPGLHCSPATHKTIGTFPEGTVRLSASCFTSTDDIELTIEAVRRIALAT